MIGRDVLGDERHHRDRPARLAPVADFLDRGRGVARRGDDHAGEAPGMAGTEILHVPVIGADHVGFERRVFVADQAGPRGRDQEMRVDTFQVHVGDAVVGLVVLHAGTRLSRPHPHRIAAAVVGARLGLAEDALEGDLAIAIDVPPGRTAGSAGPDRRAECGQLGQPVAEPGIEILVDHLGRRFDMGVGVPDLEPVLHDRPPVKIVRALYTGWGRAENARPRAADCVTLPLAFPQRGPTHHAASDLREL